MSSSKVTSFRWEVIDFRKQDLDANEKDWACGSFALLTRPSVQFEFFINGTWDEFEDFFRVNLKQFDGGKPIKASVKFWIENNSCQRFCETFVEKYMFSKVGDHSNYNKAPSYDNKDFWNSYNNHDTFFFCCEITHLNERATLTVNYEQKFQQSIWTLYEEELHDAIIKVGNTEFKVFKMNFMAHSKVFKSMFLSKFKEGTTSEIEVKDVDSETMKHLVKWFYTCQLEDDSPIEKLFAAADKYDIVLLKEMCTENMLDTLNATNTFQRLILASTHSNKNLKEATLDVISGLSTTDFAEFFTSEDWLKFYGKNLGTANEVGKLIREKMRK